MPVSLVDPFANGIVWDELVDSDSGELSFSQPSSERKWLVTGASDPDAFLTNEPGNNVPLINVRAGIPHMFKALKWGPTQPTVGLAWLVTASYAWSPEYVELSFDTSGGTTKRDQAYDVGDYYSCSGALTGLVTPGQTIPGSTATVPNFRGIVVDGVDVPDDKFDFSVLIRNKLSTLPQDFITTLGDLAGHTNDRPIAIDYKGQHILFDQEELLYHGMPGKITNEDGYELTLKFSKQKSTGAKGGTKTTANFTQPANQQNVAVTVQSTSAFHFGDIIFIAGGGRYQVASIDLATQMTVTNLGDAINATQGWVINSGAAVSFEQNPLIIGDSGPIKKLGWRYLKVIGVEQIIGGQRVSQPKYVIVNKVIPTADLSQIGIFS